MAEGGFMTVIPIDSKACSASKRKGTSPFPLRPRSRTTTPSKARKSSELQRKEISSSMIALSKEKSKKVASTPLLKKEAIMDRAVQSCGSEMMMPTHMKLNQLCVYISIVVCSFCKLPIFQDGKPVSTKQMVAAA
jgi:hypothetical protein